MDILDAIQKTAGSVIIYCQKGNIKVPPNFNKIISFIEESIVEVLPSKFNVSFHPKIWVIRYKDPKRKLIYRIIVLSRNLTFDRSWDVAFFLEGKVGQNNQIKNKPLVDYLKYLKSLKNFEKSTKFISDLSKVNFQLEEPFDNFSFHPMGFKNYSNPLIDERFEDLIIVSPFLDKKTLKHFADDKVVARERYLFSRKEELDKIHSDALRPYKTFEFSSRIIEGEYDTSLQEEANEEPMPQNLHAKIFIGSKENSTTRWYLGSANCTDPAMNRNEEFLIRLDSGDKLTSVNEMSRILLFNEDEVIIFKEYQREKEEPSKSIEYDFRQVKFKLLTFLNDPKNIKASCSSTDKQNLIYNFLLKLNRNEVFDRNDVEIKVAPYGWKGDSKKAVTTKSIIFKNITLYHLSPFLQWNMYHKDSGQTKKFLSRVSIELPSIRKQAIFRSIIENKDKFFQFIQFLLTNNTDQFSFIGSAKKKAGQGLGSGELWNQSTPLFEQLLLASSRYPKKLKDIDKAIEQLQGEGTEDIIPDEFKEFWCVFKAIIDGK
jgi:HKD family nuclease